MRPLPQVEAEGVEAQHHEGGAELRQPREALHPRGLQVQHAQQAVEAGPEVEDGRQGAQEREEDGHDPALGHHVGQGQGQEGALQAVQAEEAAGSGSLGQGHQRPVPGLEQQACQQQQQQGGPCPHGTVEQLVEQAGFSKLPLGLLFEVPGQGGRGASEEHVRGQAQGWRHVLAGDTQVGQLISHRQHKGEDECFKVRSPPHPQAEIFPALYQCQTQGPLSG